MTLTEMDGRVIAFAIGLSTLTALLFGLVPALLASKVDLNEALKQGTRGSTDSAARSRLRQLFVILQVAVATILLVSVSVVMVYSASAMIALREVEVNAGAGQVIDLPLLDPLFHVLGPQAANYRLTGKVKPRTGSRSTNSGPRNAYRCSDGLYVCLSASTQKMAERVFTAIGRPDRDPEAAAGFVRRYQARVFGLALTIVGDRATAEEVAQETFLKAWRVAAHGLSVVAVNAVGSCQSR